MDSFWPEPSPQDAFRDRRARLSARFDRPAVFPSGFSRPRNFLGNPYPFRAESHFLYFVGRQLEAALLVVDQAESVLYLDEPDAAAALWTGPEPSLLELSRELGLTVRPLETFVADRAMATLPPQDAETALWLSDLLDRDIDPASGEDLEGADAELADAVIALRLRHDAAAVAQLEQAAAITVHAHGAAMAGTRPGAREATVRARCLECITASGMVPAYQPIVTVRGNILHCQHSNDVMREGDLLLADVGAETPEGWAADVTRTWPVSGSFSSTQRELYQATLGAQGVAIAAVAPGKSFAEVHRAAGVALTSSLIELGLLRGDPEDLYQRGVGALFFPHGVGHLLGLDVHDMEDLGDRAGYAKGRARRVDHLGERHLRLDRDLEPGMLVTIEPGFYVIPELLHDRELVGDLADHVVWSALERFGDVRGIRIEDDVLVTEQGCRVLSQAAPKTIAELEEAMAKGGE